MENGERKLTEFVITSFDTTEFASLADYFEKDIKPFIDSLGYKEQSLIISTEEGRYWFDQDQKTLVEETKGKRDNLGRGRIVVKATYKNKKQVERIEITVELTPEIEKDYEIIPFHRDAEQNKAGIEAFMATYVTRPFEYLENNIGTEINFNKVFYQPEKLRDVAEILDEIGNLDNELKMLEQGLDL